MADFNLTITVPDAKVADFLDGLRWELNMPGATPAELKAAVNAEVVNNLKLRYKKWRAYQLQINPPSDEIDIQP